MKITVTDSIKIANIEVDPNELVEDVKALIEIEVAPQQVHLADVDVRGHN